LAQFLPLLILALPAGHAADRFSRKYMLMLAHATMALASLGLACVSIFALNVEAVFVFLAIAGVARALGMPARSSMIPLLVPPATLGNAVTWSVSGFQMAMMAGPATGGLLLAITESPMPELAYGVTITLLMTCIGSVSQIRLQPMAPSLEPRTLRSLLAGLRFVWQTQLLFAAITLDLFAVLLGGCTVLLPAFCEEILEVGTVGLGILRAAPAVGAFVMALLLAHRPPMTRPGRALLWSVAGFGCATIGFGLSENVYLSFAMLF